MVMVFICDYRSDISLELLINCTLFWPSRLTTSNYFEFSSTHSILDFGPRIKFLSFVRQILDPLTSDFLKENNGDEFLFQIIEMTIFNANILNFYDF